MTCSRCGGDMAERRVRFCVCELNPPLMIENVPAFVCQTCGGEVFSDATMAIFEDIRDGRVQQHRTEFMRVYDYDLAVQRETVNVGQQPSVRHAETGTAIHPIPVTI